MGVAAPGPPRRGRAADPQTGLAAGTLLVMGAEALAFPAGLLVTVLLTRHLPAADYGALALALAAIAWLEWTVVSLFSRAAYKLVAEADDWRAVAAAIVRAFLLASLPVAVIVFAAAGPAAALFGVPSLAALLRVFAFEIPIFVAAQAYRTVLVGRGQHRARAGVAALRWTLRALLVATGVLLGASLTTITMLIVAATAVELVIVRGRVRAHHNAAGSTEHARAERADLSLRRLLAYAAPLALSAICMRLFDRIDIFALRLLGGGIESVAAYGVAQNLALAPGLFGGAFTPALIAALSFRLARGDAGGARRLSADALRAGFLVLPFTLLAAGAAPALIDLLFGVRYAAAAPLFAILVVGAAFTLIIAVAGGVLVAAGRLRVTVVLTAPLLAIALAGHVLVIPRGGAVGAAAVTAGTALIGAAAACAAVRALVATPIPFATLLRGVALGTAAALAAAASPVQGILIVPVLGVLAVLLALATLATGELRDDERSAVRAWWRAHRALP